ncbi:unnamed protein product, partial [Pelagomonas calceolata]
RETDPYGGGDHCDARPLDAHGRAVDRGPRPVLDKHHRHVALVLRRLAREHAGLAEVLHLGRRHLVEVLEDLAVAELDAALEAPARRVLERLLLLEGAHGVGVVVAETTSGVGLVLDNDRCPQDRGRREGPGGRDEAKKYSGTHDFWGCLRWLLLFCSL